MSRKQWLSVKLVLLTAILVMTAIIGVKMFDSSSPSGFDFGFHMDKGMPIEVGQKKAFLNVEKVIVETINLPVHIYESDVAQVTIQDNTTVYGIGPGKPNLISHQDGVLAFKQVKQKSFMTLVKGHVIVEVPKGSSLNYQLGSISGDISHNALSKENLKVQTISGTIEIRQKGEEVSAESISGAVRIYEAFEEVSADTISGSISLVADQGTKEISGSSISGSIKIMLNKVSGYEMNYSTVSSQVEDVYSQTNYSKSGKGKTGDGSLSIDVETISGSIALEDWHK